MNEFVTVIEFLRTLHIQRGEAQLSSLLEDGNLLEAKLVANVSETTFRLSHSTLGVFTFTPHKTIWWRDGQPSISDEESDNGAMLGRLRSGVDARVEWISSAIQLARSRNAELSLALDNLGRLRNAFTAIVIPGLAWFDAQVTASPFPQISFNSLRGHIAIRNLALDLNENFIGFELSILAARIDGILGFTSGSTGSSAAPPLTSFQFNDSELQLESEFAVGLRLDPATGRISMTGADINLKSMSVRAESGRISMFGSVSEAACQNPDPLQLTTERLTLSASNVLSHVEESASGDRLAYTNGGPLRFWADSASSTKNSFPLASGDLITGIDDQPVSANLRNVCADLFVDTDRARGGIPDIRLRGAFECGSLDLQCTFQSANMIASEIRGMVSLRHGRLERDGWSVDLRGLTAQINTATLNFGTDNEPDQAVLGDVRINGNAALQSAQQPTVYSEFLRLAATEGVFRLRHPDVNSHLKLFGDGGRIDATTTDFVNFDDQLTLAARVKVHTLPSDGNLAVLIAHQVSDDAGFVWAIDEFGRMRLRLRIGGTFLEHTSTNSVSENELVSLWVYYDGNEVAFFIDEQPAGNWTQTGALELNATESSIFEIGGSATSGFQSLTGLIGDVFAWNESYQPPYGVDSHRNGLQLHMAMDRVLGDLSSQRSTIVSHGNYEFSVVPFRILFPSGIEFHVGDYQNSQAGGSEPIIGRFNIIADRLETNPPLFSLRSDALGFADCILRSETINGEGFLTLVASQESSNLRGELRLDRTSMQMRQTTLVDFDQYNGIETITEISPINSSDENVVYGSQLRFGEDQHVLGVAGLSQKFNTATIAMGGGSKLIVTPSANNRFRLNSFPLGSQEGLVAQLRIESGQLEIPASDPVQFENVQFDAYIRSIAPGLPAGLRAVVHRALMRFSLLFNIPDFSWPERVVSASLSVSDVTRILRVLSRLLNISVDLGGVERVLSQVSNLLEQVFSELDNTGIGVGIDIETRETSAEVFTGNLPDPIAPNADNQIMMKISGGTRRIRAFVTYKYPKVEWRGFETEVVWKPGKDETGWASIFFEMDVFVRVSFAFETTTRRILITDMEVWLLQSNSNTFTAIVEEGLKTFLETALNLDALKDRLLKQLNSRLSQQTNLRLPDDWDVDIARIQVGDAGVSMSVQAMISKWNDIP